MLDWGYIFSVLPSISSALWVTVKLSVWGILFAMLLGAISSIILYYRIKILAPFFQGYVAFFRNTPLLLHLYFLYYGLPKVTNILLGFQSVALIGLALIGGAYMAEAFRSGLEAVSRTQIEAGRAIGLNRFQLMRYIIFPQALSYIVPALGANSIFLFKETSVFTAIAGTDVTTVAIGLINTDYKTYELLFMLVFAYIIVLLPFVLFLSYLEKGVRRAEFGH